MKYNEKGIDGLDEEKPKQEPIWVGYDGSRIVAHRVYDGYNSLLGKATQKVTKKIIILFQQ